MAQWHGDLDAAAAIFEHAYELHRETELYSSGVYDIALIGLRWDRDGFRTPVPLREVDRTSGPWARVALCVATGRIAEADRLIGLELAARQPAVWTTYGKLTMLAHLVADIGAEHHARDLISRLTPIAHCIATIGHVGLVGPVALAVARLHHLLGETTAALAQLAVATELARRTDGLPSLRRCQALAMTINGAIDVPPGVATVTTART
ncbi:hypothetical protein GCM10022223_33820 [Kineosporia mesophila]|uniref:Uncharacterized protein n=1 Tax=Kineosporia mesophila TaxID=566012 RepID=A0ABP6ZQJ8_9ACTN|nr:hypothetical protein [Kineosporia mesophila]MCD5354747.1 hypothetical protein [Kineosporia mesophila]